VPNLITVDGGLVRALGENMTEYFNDLNKMPDEQLIAIKNGQIPYLLSAQSTTTREDVISEAETILYTRQKKDGKSIKQITLWILIFTIALVVITLFLLFLEWPSVKTNISNSEGLNAVENSHSKSYNSTK
jgi:hypothetical protein